ncbi:MAG: MBL fold metallo-hydrolase [Candidatus Heimdallarchaeota archaeon]|nr:MAG: MBL fold metallo-hydrolase [Candidatus Heimdallarchaeota archaeon]
MADSEYIIKKSGMITDDIYHLDILQYNLPRSCSIYILMTPESITIMDIGTSDDVDSILTFLTENNILLEKVKYLVPSHHHFDHFGGGWKLWKKIKEYSPDVKIVTTETTKRLLQDSKEHLRRAKRTFGKHIGIMKPLPDDAYKIVKENESIPIPGLKKQFKLISTPGHTSDHVCPTVSNNGINEFVYIGECAGGLMHSQKLVTVPSSMPPEFNFKIYMESLRKIIDLKPLNVGFAHAGVVRGQEGVKKVLMEHVDFSNYFRDFVKNKYSEKGKTRYVVEQFATLEMKKRSDVSYNELFSNYAVAVVYGQLIDLGLKEPK